MASTTGHLETVLSIVNSPLNEDGSPFDINAKDKQGNTALHWAVYNNHHAIVECLLDHNADPNVVNDQDQQTPFHWGCVTGSTESLKILLDKSRFDITIKDVKGHTPCHTAAINNQLNLIHYMLLKTMENDSTLNALSLLDCPDNNGRTPLQWACYKGHEKIIMYLLSHGVDINHVDKGGMTALHWCAQRGYSNLVNLLVFHGANIHLKNEKGLTPEELAITKSFFNIAGILGRASVQPHDKQTLDNPNYFWIWVAAPYIYLTVFVAILSVFSIIPSIFLCFISYLLIKMFLNRYWLGQDYRNPIMIGWFCALFTLSAYAYYFFMFKNAYNNSPLEQIIFHIVFFSMLFALSKLTTQDPGHIVKNKSEEDKIFIDAVELGEKPKLCTTCHHRIPLRGRHCRSCNRCVAKMDHHCGWINRCVGQKNHKLFICFVILIVMSCIFFQKIIIWHLFDVYNIEGGMKGFLYSLPAMYRNTPIFVLLLFVHLAFSGYELYLLYDQFNLISANMLLVEALDLQKVTYFWYNGTFRNPFDFGPAENITSFLKNETDWSNVYTAEGFRIQSSDSMV